MSYICISIAFAMEKKILVVDDEAGIREILQFNLETAGFTVDCASSAEEALDMLEDGGYSLILLDVMMGGMSGFRMAEVLRNDLNDQIPIIFLTAKTERDDLLTGFSSGGDDYIPKPFFIQEVIARVKAVLKRLSPSEDTSDVINASKVKIDLKTKMVYVCGEAVTFSKKEFEVLSLLAGHPGQIYSREDIITELWKDAPYVLDRTVDVHIARIRSKLGECKNYITNRTGYGYVFNTND